jgi:hypothetical protein
MCISLEDAATTPHLIGEWRRDGLHSLSAGLSCGTRACRYDDAKNEPDKVVVRSIPGTPGDWGVYTCTEGTRGIMLKDSPQLGPTSAKHALSGQ